MEFDFFEGRIIIKLWFSFVVFFLYLFRIVLGKEIYREFCFYILLLEGERGIFKNIIFKFLNIKIKDYLMNFNIEFILWNKIKLS